MNQVTMHYWKGKFCRYSLFTAPENTGHFFLCKTIIFQFDKNPVNEQPNPG